MRVGFLFLSLVSLALPTLTRGQCTLSYAELQALTTAFVSSIPQGRLLSTLPGLATATYTENFKPASIARAPFAAGPLRVDYNRSLHDTTQCATYTEMVSLNPGHPYVIGTQIRWDTEVKGGVKLVESLVTDQGDWLFNATAWVQYATREDWYTIPVEKRDTRAVIQAGADAYLDIWKDKSVKVPFGLPCARLEGGAYTGRGLPTDTCDVGVPVRIVDMVNRRYVIDETVGAVDVFVGIGSCKTSRPDSHEFRLEGGKLRFIHTLTIMDPSCPGIPSQVCECPQPRDVVAM